jgi:hypothetical protein
MASEKRIGPRERNRPVRKKKSPPRNFYFYLGGELHQKLHIDRGADLITCWSYVEHKRTAYPWSETKRKMTSSYKTSEVVKLLNRSRVTRQRAIIAGDIRKPAQPYTLDKERRVGKFCWSQANVMEARDFFATQHVGFKRNDGLITAKPIPSRAELRAMMEQGTVTYVKTSDGEFIPTFKEIVW